jgi:hypothetical protein
MDLHCIAMFKKEMVVGIHTWWYIQSSPPALDNKTRDNSLYAAANTWSPQKAPSLYFLR